MVLIKVPINESMTEAIVELNLGMQPALDPAYATRLHVWKDSLSEQEIKQCQLTIQVRKQPQQIKL